MLSPSGETTGSLKKGEIGNVVDVDSWCERPYAVRGPREELHWYRVVDLVSHKISSVAYNNIHHVSSISGSSPYVTSFARTPPPVVEYAAPTFTAEIMVSPPTFIAGDITLAEFD